MGFPPILYIYKLDGSQTKVTGALAFTRKRVVCYGTPYRDSFNAAWMGAGYLPYLVPNAPTVATAKIGGFPIGADGADVDVKTSTISDSSLSKDTVSLPDEVSHYPWRSKQYLRYLWQFWDAATVGEAISLTVTTVSGSANVTVADSQLLTPGQEISGAGIPVGARISDFLTLTSGSMQINQTQVQLTMQCTASATVTATLTGANLLATAFEDECSDWGEAISYPV
jgi:hypothetical protein